MSDLTSEQAWAVFTGKVVKPLEEEIMKDHAMSDLLPCPFCGGDADLMHPEEFDDNRGTVMCMTCYSVSPDKESWKDAVTAWNTRALPRSEPAGEVGELDEGSTIPLTEMLTNYLRRHPYFDERKVKIVRCKDIAEAAATIQQQQAEIERLTKGNDDAFVDGLRHGGKGRRPIEEVRGEAEIIKLQAYKDELLKIAESLGEGSDPFAAWESVAALKARVSELEGYNEELHQLLSECYNDLREDCATDPDALNMIYDALQKKEALSTPKELTPNPSTANEDSAKTGAEGVSAAQDVINERKRQVQKECWDHAHDDRSEGSIAMAAAYYAFPTAKKDLWPWSNKPKRKSRRRDLVRAGALILAEIERLDRADPSTEREGG